jgi:hypothetical protein
MTLMDEVALQWKDLMRIRESRWHIRLQPDIAHCRLQFNNEHLDMATIQQKDLMQISKIRKDISLQTGLTYRRLLFNNNIMDMAVIQWKDLTQDEEALRRILWLPTPSQTTTLLNTKYRDWSSNILICQRPVDIDMMHEANLL